MQKYEFKFKQEKLSLSMNIFVEIVIKHLLN